MVALIPDWYRDLSRERKNYLLIEQSCIPAAVNLIVNAGLGLLAFRGLNEIPVWGWHSTAVADTLGTCFLLPAITCVIVTNVVRWQLRSGVVAPAATDGFAPQFLRHFQYPILLRALMFGSACFGILAPIAVGCYFVLPGDAVSPNPFILFKALSSAAFGAAITPVIAIVALHDSPNAASQP